MLTTAKVKICEIIVNERIATPINKDSIDFKNLFESIKKNGIMIPLRLSGKFQPFNNNIEFTLIDGLRRLEIAKDLGITEVPAFVEMSL